MIFLYQKVIFVILFIRSRDEALCTLYIGGVAAAEKEFDLVARHSPLILDNDIILFNCLFGKLGVDIFLQVVALF